MNLKSLFFLTGFLLGGCAATGGSSESGGSAEEVVSTAVVAKSHAPEARPERQLTYRERFGNWKIDCSNNPLKHSSHCKAENFGPITTKRGKPEFRDSIVLWVSWVKGTPKNQRSVCVFGHRQPIEELVLQVDKGKPARLPARKASGCFHASEAFLQQMRSGQRLNVTFRSWPWGETKAFVSLDKSANALDELVRLVKDR
jgi:hypothetical protein